MNSHTTRRPRIGLIEGRHAAVEVLDDNDDLVWYSDSIDGRYEWLPSADFTPLAEVPAPRMDEPQETWATVAADAPLEGGRQRLFVRAPDCSWVLLGSDGRWTGARCHWDNLNNPRPTTPTERATGIVGGAS